MSRRPIEVSSTPEACRHLARDLDAQTAAPGDAPADRPARAMPPQAGFLASVASPATVGYALIVPTAYERLGGDALRKLLDDFYDRVFADPMIGFLFHGSDRARLVQKEWELSAAMLGGKVRYTGRPMRPAHARAPILGGHFARRQQLLRETLADHGVPDDISREWLAHNERLRPQITADAGSECSHAHAEARLATETRRLPLAGSAPVAPGQPAAKPRRDRLLKLGRWPG